MRAAAAVRTAFLIALIPAVLEAQPARPLPSVESMGVSFDRIKREVAKPIPARPKDAIDMKLEYYIDVVAAAPPFLLFAPGEAEFGPVSGTAPSHADMMRHVTPLAFSAPAATLISFGASRGSPRLLGQDFWLVQTQMAKELERRKKLEAERARKAAIKSSVVVTPPKGPGT